jgi:hypothetical protein
MRRILASALLATSLSGCGMMQSYNQSLDARQQAYDRQQKVLDEQNIIQINDMKVKQNQQLIGLAKSQAEINKQTAIGQREAQAEVQKSLTTLYVQHEFAQAVEDGKVNTIFMPVGGAGVPLLTDPMNFTQKAGVTAPAPEQK